jgi:hypothetical protein
VFFDALAGFFMPGTHNLTLVLTGLPLHSRHVANPLTKNNGLFIRLHGIAQKLLREYPAAGIP